MKRWRLLALILALFLVPVGLGWRCQSIQVDRVWERMRTKVAAAQKKLENRSSERPALWGELKDGRAFEEYQKVALVIPRSGTGRKAR